MVLYRIVLTDPPSTADFVSEASRGLERRVRPEYERLRSGISVFDTEDRARQRATKWPWLGGYIAELAVPEDGGAIRYQRTTESRGHYTIWGQPEDLVGRVVRVFRV